MKLKAKSHRRPASTASHHLPSTFAPQLAGYLPAFCHSTKTCPPDPLARTRPSPLTPYPSGSPPDCASLGRRSTPCSPLRRARLHAAPPARPVALPHCRISPSLRLRLPRPPLHAALASAPRSPPRRASRPSRRPPALPHLPRPPTAPPPVALPPDSASSGLQSSESGLHGALAAPVISSKKPALASFLNPKLSEMIDLVIEAGAEERSDEHFYATQLLIKEEYRDVFHTLKTPQGRLAWLTRTWEEKKRR